MDDTFIFSEPLVKSVLDLHTEVDSRKSQVRFVEVGERNYLKAPLKFLGEKVDN